MASVARLRRDGEGRDISSDLNSAVTFSRHLTAGSVIRMNTVIFCLILLTN